MFIPSLFPNFLCHSNIRVSPLFLIPQPACPSAAQHPAVHETCTRQLDQDCNTGCFSSLERTTQPPSLSEHLILNDVQNWYSGV